MFQCRKKSSKDIKPDRGDYENLFNLFYIICKLHQLYLIQKLLPYYSLNNQKLMELIKSSPLINSSNSLGICDQL